MQQDTFKKFISKLNWRQILIHFIASCFFIFAFKTISVLCNVKIVDAYRHSNGGFERQLHENGILGSDLMDFFIWTGVSGAIGLVTAFVVSLAISIWRKWFWINSLLTFILTFLLLKFGSLGWDYLKKIFWLPGQLFSSTTVEFALNGSILLAIGFLLFFLKRPNEFIENKNKYYSQE